MGVTAQIRLPMPHGLPQPAEQEPQPGGVGTIILISCEGAGAAFGSADLALSVVFLEAAGTSPVLSFGEGRVGCNEGSTALASVF